MKRHRLTAKEPENNYDTLMNYAYVKDDKLIYLRYAGGEKDIALHEYAAKACKEKGCDIEADFILEESLIDCPDCPIAIMYYLGCQAGASNKVLMEYEDAEIKIEAKIYDIICGQCNGRTFKFVAGKYKCQDCGYTLTNDDIERLLDKATENELNA